MTEIDNVILYSSTEFNAAISLNRLTPQNMLQLRTHQANDRQLFVKHALKTTTK